MRFAEATETGILSSLSCRHELDFVEITLRVLPTALGLTWRSVAKISTQNAFPADAGTGAICRFVAT